MPEVGIEPTNKRFAVSRLTTWLLRGEGYQSYHNDPAQQHGSIAEDLLRKETIARIEAEKNAQY